MTTAASRPVPAHELPRASTPPTTVSKPDNLNFQGLPIPRGPVTSSLSFYAAPKDGSPPHNYVEPLPGVPQRNWGDDWQEVHLEDIRGREDSFTLDTNAFDTYSHVPSAATDFTSDTHIRAVYYPEVEQLLLTHLAGAHRVVLFDHTIRRPTGTRLAVQRAHIDQTPMSAAERVKLHAPDDAENLLRGRYRIVNVWRPLNGPVMNMSLAVADSQTVRDEDLVPIEHRYPTRTGQTAAVRFNSEQKWYYWSGMTDDERLLLKCYDSDEGVGRWGRVPHTAFVDPRSPEGAVGRESIEVRALVFG